MATARELIAELSNIPGANLDDQVYVRLEGGQHDGLVLYPVQGAAMGVSGAAEGKPCITVTGDE